MWLFYALASALFAGIVSILAKIGIKNIDSTLATALRTIVVLIFAWLMVFIVGSEKTITSIDAKSFIFLILSGLATGISWLCYFKALQIGDVNKVVPVDKSSTIFTMLLSFIILGEKINVFKIIAMILIGIGTYLMIEKVNKSNNNQEKSTWLLFAFLSAIFSSLTSILGKVGIENVESNLGTAIRTIVVLIMAWIIVFANKKQTEIKYIDKRSWLFIALSGLATGLSWLCFYRALQDGPVSVVVPIDKLSIIITVIFGYIILGEKLSRKAVYGFLMIIVGTLALLI